LGFWFLFVRVFVENVDGFVESVDNLKKKTQKDFIIRLLFLFLL
jgi:hypothetical protein